ncbi:MAG TPA: alpha/beta hydrolase-fold protein [Chitinophagaceae bacterium]|nr:alpha/beta hydrolase-fold protein [Chitinophagaceae bacterium]
MIRNATIFLFLLAGLCAGAQNRVEFVVKSVPTYTTATDPLYVAGNFNGWDPGSEKYRFRKKDDHYFLEIELPEGFYEFKITRGSWEKVECSGNGVPILNRVVQLNNDSRIEVNVEGWQDHFPARTRRSTATQQVHILDTAFRIPQLDRKRRVWIYLPKEYFRTKKRYPVIYMHDGQNVFDDSTSGFGEWGVDEFLDSARKKSIVVAVDHGGDRRLNEYSPYDLNLPNVPLQSNKGEGDQYLDFLVRTLKPFIDRKYRTLKDKNNTIIAGSSMGGLISFYAVMKHPQVFGAAGVFSPAFWVAPRIYDEIRTRGRSTNARIYFFAGKLEGEAMVPGMLRALEHMHGVSRSKMISVIRDEGRHNEATWRREFPLFYTWVMNLRP